MYRFMQTVAGLIIHARSTEEVGQARRVQFRLHIKLNLWQMAQKVRFQQANAPPAVSIQDICDQ